MLSLLEHMYHELQIVKEFNINPITLKRWLVGRSFAFFEQIDTIALLYLLYLNLCGISADNKYKQLAP